MGLLVPRPLQQRGQHRGRLSSSRCHASIEMPMALWRRGRYCCTSKTAPIRHCKSFTHFILVACWSSTADMATLRAQAARSAPAQRSPQSKACSVARPSRSMCWRAVPRPTARRRRLPATAPLTVCGLVPGDRDSLKEERLRMFRIVSNDCATPAARHLPSAATF